MPFNLREIRKQAESQAVLRALGYAKGNVSQAASLLGITRPTFYALVNKYNLGQNPADLAAPEDPEDPQEDLPVEEG